MTNDELNRLYHEHVEGGKVGRRYVGMGIWGEHPIPDCASDPAVFKRCAVEMMRQGYITYYVLGKYHVAKDSDLDKILVSNPDPQHAVMLAVLKKRGVDITRTGGEEK